METTSSLRSLGAIAIATGSIAAVLIVYAVHGGMKHNPMNLPFEKAVNAQAWIPEGWKFFTRDAREDRTAMFVRHDGAWKSASRTPNANPSNWFGLDRLGRAQGVELGLIMQDVPSSAWQPCQSDVSSCFESSPPTLHIKNISPSPSLCGAVGLTLQQPVPWAWAHDRLKVTMPTKFVRLEVQC